MQRKQNFKKTKNCKGCTKTGSNVKIEKNPRNAKLAKDEKSSNILKNAQNAKMQRRQKFQKKL